MRRKIMSLMLVLGFALTIGCSDDSGIQATDSAIIPKDGGVKKDGQVTPDQGKPQLDQGKPQLDKGKPQQDMTKPKQDQGKPQQDLTKPKQDQAAPSKLNCSQIGKCSDTCANKCPGGIQKLTCMMKCSTDCKAKGCTKAQPVYSTLYNCISTKCMLQCMNGPNATCKTCVTKQCTTQEKACAAQKC